MGANRVILVGNLGRDPELRIVGDGLAVCTMSVATGERRRSSDGTWQDHTQWHRVVVYGKRAEHCTSYLKKGRQVYIEGRIETEKWKDKEDVERYVTKIIATNVIFLGTRPDGAPTAEIEKPQDEESEPKPEVDIASLNLSSADDLEAARDF